MTKDSVTVYVSAIMWYKVKDATSAVANVDDYSESAKLLAATTLRNVLGTRNLGEILSERESIAQEMEVNIIKCSMIICNFIIRLIWMRPQRLGGFRLSVLK
jgi:hypothetical protein